MTSLPPIEQLYRSHGALVLRRARAILSDENEAQEVLHDVFTSLLHNPSLFEGRSSIVTFLYGVTTNVALQRLRNQRNRERLLRRHLEGRLDHLPQTQEAKLQWAELLESLPDELCQIAVYYYVDELTQSEIAETLGCSRQWVGKLLDRLRRTRELQP